MRIIHALAPAKINIFLRITGSRPDGYHLLDSLMIPISLYDEIRIAVNNEKRNQERDTSQLTLTCNEPTIPNNETNLVYRAASLLLQEARIQATVAIHLHKNIPAGAGLGGGSSDAAATLKGLNTLLELGFSEERLCQLGSRLGADIPFFIPCRPSRVEGIGEILTIVPPLPHRWIVLVVPPFSISTPWAYQQFDKLSPLSLEDQIPAASFAAGQWPISALLVNHLERAIFPEYPQIAEIKSIMLSSTTEGALMSGSGSSVFGIFQNRAQAKKTVERLRKHGKTFLVEPLREPPAFS